MLDPPYWRINVHTLSGAEKEFRILPQMHESRVKALDKALP